MDLCQPPLSQPKLLISESIFFGGTHPVADGRGTRLDAHKTWIFKITSDRFCLWCMGIVCITKEGATSRYSLKVRMLRPIALRKGECPCVRISSGWAAPVRSAGCSRSFWLRGKLSVWSTAPMPKRDPARPAQAADPAIQALLGLATACLSGRPPERTGVAVVAQALQAIRLGRS